MVVSTSTLLSETQYSERFLEAVAFYDHYLKANPEKLTLPELMAKAIKKAELPVVGEEKLFIESVILYHGTNSVFSGKLIRYFWARYVGV